MFVKKIRKIKIYLCVVLCAISALFAPATTIVTHAAVIDEVMPCTNYREWIFKVEDGKLYKRLYNASTGLWETDWIYVCEYTED